METRALSIAFFYAIGTAIGGITGPLLFSKMIASGDESQAGIAFLVGAVIMIIGGVVEMFFGVKAEQRSLEDIAEPLTAEDAKGESSGQAERPAPSRRGRYRPGPSTRGGYSPGMPVSSQDERPAPSREVERILAALEEHGTMDRTELARAVGARFWGPGRFASALGDAVTSGRAHRVGRHSFAAGPGPRAGGRFNRGDGTGDTRSHEAARTEGE
jgi:hypothetical protein